MQERSKHSDTQCSRFRQESSKHSHTHCASFRQEKKTILTLIVSALGNNTDTYYRILLHCTMRCAAPKHLKWKYTFIAIYISSFKLCELKV